MMRLCWRWGGAIGLLGAAVSIAFLVSSCSTVERAVNSPPQIEGATFVGDKTCADCHTNITRLFPSSPHARVHQEDLKMIGATGCESCHGPGSKHVAAGGGRGRFIINPHKDATTCFQCHLDVHAQFNLPHHHPVVENRMNCVDCHDPHGPDIMKPAGGLAMARLNQTCAPCHREQARRVVFEHEALREGCTVCHTVHGSINPKLLLQRDANLCLRCHAQVQMPVPGFGADELFIGKIPHRLYLRQGTCWSAGCHTAIHGSNLSPQLRY